MKKIHVQSRLTLVQTILLSAACIALGCFFVWFIFFRGDFSSDRTRGDCYELLALLIFTFPLLFKSALNKSRYVSDIVIADDELKLIYKIRNKITKVKNIALSDIERVFAELECTRTRVGRSNILSTKTKITINLCDGKKVIFNQEPSDMALKCPYEFFLKLSLAGSVFPKFETNLKEIPDDIREDIIYYLQNGRHIPFYKKKIPLASKVLLTVAAVLALASFGMLAYLSMPMGVLNDTQKEYMSHLSQGYRYYQLDNYEQALNEYEKAQSLVSNDSELYKRKAWVYEEKKDYKKVIEECNKALENLSNKSVYKVANNYKFDLKPEVSIYTTRGKAYYHLGDYSSAEADFTKVIEKLKYKYTNVYNWRAYSRWWQKNYKGALEDFIAYRNIITQYLIDQEQSEYKAKYPTYDAKDLNKVNENIKKLGGI